MDYKHTPNQHSRTPTLGRHYRAPEEVDDPTAVSAKAAAAEHVLAQTPSEDAPVVLDAAEQSGYRRGSA